MINLMIICFSKCKKERKTKIKKRIEGVKSRNHAR